jgi:hypothetical protein
VADENGNLYGLTGIQIRRILSIVLNTVFRFVLNLPILDLSSGFRLYRRRALDSLRVESRDFDVLEEILVLGRVENRRDPVSLHAARVRRFACQAHSVRRSLR